MRITLLILFSSLMITCSDNKTEVVELVSFNDIENTNEVSKIINSNKLCKNQYWSIILLSGETDFMLTQLTKEAVFVVVEGAGKTEVKVILLDGYEVFVIGDNTDLIKSNNKSLKVSHKPISIKDYPFGAGSFWTMKKGIVLEKKIISCN